MSTNGFAGYVNGDFGPMKYRHVFFATIIAILSVMNESKGLESQEDERCFHLVETCPSLFNFDAGILKFRKKAETLGISVSEFFEMDSCEMQEYLSISWTEFQRISMSASEICKGTNSSVLAEHRITEPLRSLNEGPQPVTPNKSPPPSPRFSHTCSRLSRAHRCSRLSRAHPAASLAQLLADFRDFDCGPPPDGSGEPALAAPVAAVTLDYFLRPTFALYGCAVPGLPLGPDGRLALPAGIRRLKIDVGLAFNAPNSQLWLEK
jgi:hypothetical protein